MTRMYYVSFDGAASATVGDEFFDIELAFGPAPLRD